MPFISRKRQGATQKRFGNLTPSPTLCSWGLESHLKQFSVVGQQNAVQYEQPHRFCVRQEKVFQWPKIESDIKLSVVITSKFYCGQMLTCKKETTSHHKFLFTGIQPSFADALHNIIEITPKAKLQQNQRIARAFGCS